MAGPSQVKIAKRAAEKGLAIVDAPVSGGVGGAQAGTYVTVSAQAVYNTLLPYPLLPSSYTLTAQSTVRTQ